MILFKNNPSHSPAHPPTPHSDLRTTHDGKTPVSHRRGIVTWGEADGPGAPWPCSRGPPGSLGEPAPPTAPASPVKCFLPQTQHSAHRGLSVAFLECPSSPVLLGFFSSHEGRGIKRPIYAGLGFRRAHLHAGLLDGWCFRDNLGTAWSLSKGVDVVGLAPPAFNSGGAGCCLRATEMPTAGSGRVSARPAMATSLMGFHQPPPAP